MALSVSLTQLRQDSIPLIFKLMIDRNIAIFFERFTLGRELVIIFDLFALIRSRLLAFNQPNFHSDPLPSSPTYSGLSDAGSILTSPNSLPDVSAEAPRMHSPRDSALLTPAAVSELQETDHGYYQRHTVLSRPLRPRGRCLTACADIRSQDVYQSRHPRDRTLRASVVVSELRVPVSCRQRCGPPVSVSSTIP